MPINKFINAVLAGPRCQDSSAIFNPWADYDAVYDLSAASPTYRLEHLRQYMVERLQTARYLLIAEAPGYCGAKFSGIAMTSERNLLESNAQLLDNLYFNGPKHRTSNPSSDLINNKGMLERTATIVWDKVLSVGLNPHEFVLWNCFAWHPHKPGDRMSNRAPSKAEKLAGTECLQRFLEMFPGRTVLSIGDHSQGLLSGLNVDFKSLRHPSYGGAPVFRSGIDDIINNKAANLA